MPKARQSCAIGSPSRSCATNRRRSSITEHSFHGIHTSRFWEKPEGVTHVSGTNCHPCLGPLINGLEGISAKFDQTPSGKRNSPRSIIQCCVLRPAKEVVNGFDGSCRLDERC